MTKGKRRFKAPNCRAASACSRKLSEYQPQILKTPRPCLCQTPIVDSARAIARNHVDHRPFTSQPAAVFLLGRND